MPSDSMAELPLMAAAINFMMAMARLAARAPYSGSLEGCTFIAGKYVLYGRFLRCCKAHVTGASCAARPLLVSARSNFLLLRQLFNGHDDELLYPPVQLSHLAGGIFYQLGQVLLLRRDNKALPQLEVPVLAHAQGEAADPGMAGEHLLYLLQQRV